MNKVMLLGTLTRDPELRQAGETTVARFSIAVNRKTKNAEGKYDADFINCVSFGKQAELISKYFSKGKRIGIEGHIQTGSYTNKNGQKVYTTDVIIDGIDFIEKASGNNTANSANNSTNDFVNVPDDIAEELPFD